MGLKFDTEIRLPLSFQLTSWGSRHHVAKDKQANESRHQGSTCHEQVWTREGFVDEVRAQAKSVQHLVEHSCFRCTKGDQEDWRVHYSRYLQVEDTYQTSDQGWQERDLR